MIFKLSTENGILLRNKKISNLNAVLLLSNPKNGTEFVVSGSGSCDENFEESPESSKISKNLS